MTTSSRSFSPGKSTLFVRLVGIGIALIMMLSASSSASTTSGLAQSSMGSHTDPGAAGNSTANWGQYQSSSSHNGYTSASGPNVSTIGWTHDAGQGQLGVVAMGTNLVVFSPANESIYTSNLSTGGSTSTTSIWVENTEPVLTTSDLYYAYCNCYYGSEVSDLALSTGTYVWQHTPASSYRWVFSESNSILEAGTLGANNLWGYSSSSGNLAWSDGLPGQLSTIPTAGGKLIAVGYGNLPEVSALTYYSGALTWNFTTDSIVTSPALAYSSGHFLFGTQYGTVYSLNSSGGMNWSFNDGGAAIVTTPTVAFNTVFVGSSTGSFYALNESTGKLIWSDYLGGSLDVSPVVGGNGLVYTGGTLGEIYALNSTTGRTSWSRNLGAPIGDGLVLGKDVLVATTVDGFLYVFGPSGPTGNLPAVGDTIWSQFQGDGAHNGSSAFPGPMSSKVAWMVNTGTPSDVGFSGMGSTLFVSIPANQTMLQLDVRNGSQVLSSSVPIETTTFVSSFDNYELNFVWNQGYYGSNLMDWQFPQYYAFWSHNPAGYASWTLGGGYGNLYAAGLGQNVLWGYREVNGNNLWAKTVAGYVTTVPTVADYQVVVGYSNSPDVSAFDYANGSVNWTFVANGPVASSSIAASGDHFYFGTTLDRFYSVSDKGKKAWDYHTAGRVTTTAAVGSGRVYFGAGAYLYALNAAKGTLDWKVKVGGKISSSPVLSANGLVYIGNSKGLVAAYYQSNGTLVWSKGLKSSINDGMMLANGMLIVSTASARIYAF